jgi:hypothetical protein
LIFPGSEPSPQSRWSKLARNDAHKFTKNEHVGVIFDRLLCISCIGDDRRFRLNNQGTASGQINSMVVGKNIFLKTVFPKAVSNKIGFQRALRTN